MDGQRNQKTQMIRGIALNRPSEPDRCPRVLQEVRSAFSSGGKMCRHFGTARFCRSRAARGVLTVSTEFPRSWYARSVPQRKSRLAQNLTIQLLLRAENWLPQAGNG
jgi:hypothetical protein